MNDIEIYGELMAMYHTASEQKQQEIVSFLCFCAERLKAGASVETIWNEWEEQSA